LGMGLLGLGRASGGWEAPAARLDVAVGCAHRRPPQPRPHCRPDTPQYRRRHLQAVPCRRPAGTGAGPAGPGSERAPTPRPVRSRSGGHLAELLGVALLSRLSGTSPKAIYRYRRGARWPGGPLQRRLLHLNDVIAALRQGHSDHQIAQWFSSEIAPGVRPTHLLEGSWSPDEEGPRRLLEIARGDTSEDETRHSILVAEGPSDWAPEAHTGPGRELVDSQGLEQVANVTAFHASPSSASPR